MRQKIVIMLLSFLLISTTAVAILDNSVSTVSASSIQLKMNGSTTVTDLMNVMVPAFEQNNSGYQVSVSGTGSGAGLTAIESGSVDMGMISLPENEITPGTSTAYPNLVQHIVAYDGVSIFMAASTLAAHGITVISGESINMNQTLADAIYQDYKDNALANSSGFTTANLGYFNNGVTSLPSWGTATRGFINTWADLEAVLGVYGQNSIRVSSDSNADKALNVYHRSDSSGTQDAFSIEGLGSSASAKFLPSHAPSSEIGANGNPAMVTAVMGDSNGIGFATTGIVSTTTGAVSCIWDGITPTYQHILEAVNNVGNSQYTLWHPLIIVTNGAPSASVEVFLNWITTPANNIALCHQAGFASIYDTTQSTIPSAPSGLQGVAGYRQVSLSWNAPANGGSPITGYKIYREIVPGAFVYLTTINATSYTDKSLTNGQAYSYTVSAVNSVGEGPQSSNVTVTPSIITAWSPTGSGVSTSSLIKVMFSEAMNTSSVKIDVNASGATISGSVTWSGNNATFTPSSALTYNTAYSVYVSGKDLTNNSATENWSFTTMKNEGIISGTILDANGKPIAGATVNLSSGMTTTTDQNGTFLFNNVTSGLDTLTIAKDGYVTFTENATIVAGSTSALGDLTMVSSSSSSSTSSDNTWIIVLVVIIAIVVIVAVVMVYMKKKPKTP
jgi:ABC-type phosphate transport system substrate-binding protein